MTGPSSTKHPLARALLVLTFTTGIIDAASYLGLGHVFTANMTGNIILLGFGIAGSGGLPVIAPLVSLLAFLTGSIIGSRLAAALPFRAMHLSRALLVEALVVALAALLAIGFTITPDRVSGDLVIALLACGMGVRNATVKRIGFPDLTTTVLTMTLTGLAADSPLAGGSGKGSVRRGVAVLAMLTGAISGALLLKVHLALVLAVAALLALLTWVAFVPAAIATERRASEQGERT
ncbi:MAG: YoaK family protein [Solirubrobacterales bacterium]